MSLNAQAIAVSGYGYGAQLMAVSGYGTVASEVFGGGWEHVRDYRRTEEEISEARKKYGLAFEVIEIVAFRQSNQLLTDKQKIFDELSGELKLNGLQFEAKYLEALNNRREQLINIEISKLLRLRIEEEEIFMMLSYMVANRMI